jgi:YD repeat-containing protein
LRQRETCSFPSNPFEWRSIGPPWEWLTQTQQGTSITIAYDDADRRTSVTYPNTNKVEYLYNVASELTTVTYKKGTTTLGTLTYTYDAAGNRLKTGGTFARSNLPPALATTSYNANNQQTTFGTSIETYDLNGNLATFTDASGTTTYTWNARNQLTSIAGPSLCATFSYDSFGRRTGRPSRPLRPALRLPLPEPSKQPPHWALLCLRS